MGKSAGFLYPSVRIRRCASAGVHPSVRIRRLPAMRPSSAMQADPLRSDIAEQPTAHTD